VRSSVSSGLCATRRINPHLEDEILPQPADFLGAYRKLAKV